MTGNDVELVGMLWGGAPPCEYDVATDTYECKGFIASDLPSIEEETGGGADLQFVPSGSGGGGGGGGPPPPPCPPNCLESVDPSRSGGI